MFKTLVGRCLKSFGSGPSRHMTKSIKNGQFSTRFRNGFAQVSTMRNFQKSGRIPNLQTDRKVLLKGLRGGACSKPSWGFA